jgi:hypothetical protein
MLHPIAYIAHAHVSFHFRYVHVSRDMLRRPFVSFSSRICGIDTVSAPIPRRAVPFSIHADPNYFHYS